MNLSQLPQAIATAILDMAVNLGQANAVRLSQKAANLTSDGVLGPKTMSALQGIDAPTWLYDVLGYLQDYYVDLGKDEFLKGWLARSRRMILLMEPVKSPQLLP
jgi:lysozyme family protein